MSIIESVRNARCEDCKYVCVKRFKNIPYLRSWCNLKQKETKQKNIVCDDWKY